MTRVFVEQIFSEYQENFKSIPVFVTTRVESTGELYVGRQTGTTASCEHEGFPEDPAYFDEIFYVCCLLFQNFICCPRAKNALVD